MPTSVGAGAPRERAKLCLFCGPPGPGQKKKPSREHVFSEWMHPFLRPTVDVTDLVSGHDVNFGGEVKELRRQRLRHGNKITGHRAPPLVCAACNSGWMGDLEEQVKPHLLPLIEGTLAPITPDAQDVLAQWITIKMMMIDLIQYEGVGSFTADEYAQFYKSRTVPSALKIYAGYLVNDYWAQAYEIRGVNYIDLVTGETRCITATFLGIERVFLFGFYSAWPEAAFPSPVGGASPGVFHRLAVGQTVQFDKRRPVWSRDIMGLHQRFQEVGAKLMPRNRPRRFEKFAVKPVTPGAELQRPATLPLITGPELFDLVCGGCPAVLYEGVSPRMLQDAWAAPADRELFVQCPRCGSTNFVPRSIKKP